VSDSVYPSGHGDPAVTAPGCAPPPGHVGTHDDCDDALASRHPGAPEVPYDAVDQDCDGADLVDAAGDGSAGGSGTGVSATAAAAAAADEPIASASPRGGPASAASYSATVANTGNPADAASARDAASPATIDSRRLLTTASRERRRKFIRDVAIREPYGTTRATFVPVVERIRDAADVISSSTSR